MSKNFPWLKLFANCVSQFYLANKYCLGTTSKNHLHRHTFHDQTIEMTDNSVSPNACAVVFQPCSSRTSWSYRRWKITRNSIKFWLIIPGKLPSVFLYIHVDSINLKTKPVKVVQSDSEFTERQGKRSFNIPSWREDWGT